MHRGIGILIVLLLNHAALSSQIVATTGYANSRRPDAPEGGSVDSYFDAGGGYAVGVRVDVDRELFWFGPSFLFWNNLTGDPHHNYNSNYFQIELGGRLSARTRTIPSLYGGIGLGYTVAHGEVVPKFEEFGGELDFDGEFPTASIHVGARTPSKTHGIAILAEASYHVGLDTPTGDRAIGPAQAWLIQIGVGFDTRFSPER